MARENAVMVGMTGAGFQARGQIEGICSVRKIDSVKVFDGVPEVAAKMTQGMSAEQRIEICGDRNRITQVVSYVLSNAAKYSGSESEILVSMDHELDITTICIRDQGIGMSQEDLAQVFAPFFRAADPQTQSESGTGLGLVIAKSIVELHGGTISVESEHDIGSVVTIEIPDCGRVRHPDHTAVKPVNRIPETS